MSIIISGIQQMGIGVKEVYEAFKWYRQNFGFDVLIFDEEAEAKLMLPYTGGQPQKRHALLVQNLQGGGGLEIWQYKSKDPQNAKFEIKLGDLGIFISKLKMPNAKNSFDFFKQKNINLLTEIVKDPEGKEHFYLTDPYGNIFETVLFDDWYKLKGKATGGIGGAVIGVDDMEKSIKFYSDILGYDTIVYDKQGVFDDFKNLPGGDEHYRRVLLRHSQPRKGHFSLIFGKSEIELVKALDRQPQKIYKDRYWGELGFIHLCYDITGMQELREKCKNSGYPFTVDSEADMNKSFDMGEAAGHFAYIEDPNGTLIEFVETHKIPILKKFNIYLNLTKRNPEKPLPRFITNALNFMKVKD